MSVQKMQKSTLLSVVLVFLLAVLPTEVRSAEAVEFADAALQHAVADALGLEPGAVVTREGLLQLESLRVRDAGITSLSGLEWARNLTELDVRGNDVRDLAPLSGLVRLEWLSLRENRALRDVGPLADLAELHYLNLNRNHLVKSIVPLAGLVNLETLILRGVGVLGREEERLVLAGLPNLERLNVRDTGLDSLSVIEDGLEDGRYEEQLDLRENPVRIGQDLVPFSPHIEELQYSRPEFSARMRLEGWSVYDYGEGEWRPEYDMDVRLRLDAEPRSFLRAFAALDIDLNTEEMEYELSVDELFFQLSVTDWLRVRAGRQKMGWGEARLFSNAADFVGDIDDGAAVRLDLDGFGSRLTAVVHSGQEVLEYRDFARAARLQGKLIPSGWLRYGVSAWYRADEFKPLRAAAYLSAGSRVEVTLEAAAWWLLDDETEGFDGNEGDGFVTANAVWRPADWRLTGEFQFDSRSEPDGLRHLGFEARSPYVSRYRATALWKHEFSEAAGVFEPKLETQLLDSLVGVLRLPLEYGGDESEREFAAGVEIVVNY